MGKRKAHIIFWPSIFLQISGYFISKYDFSAGCVLFFIGVAGCIAYLVFAMSTE